MAVPESVGPGNSFVDGIFALTTQVLPNYAMVHHKMIYESSALKEEGKKALSMPKEDAVEVILPLPPILYGSVGLEPIPIQKKNAFFPL